ncbi:hypothetical protein ACFPOE_07815 [Caenimonas terrae]|uniref:Uncharacterized protein n=1 Tax=Caenimonas terrae TaxID=696074 RepID=A0ABW0NAY8_9BURK
MNIHQLSVTYLPDEDRILARINTTAGEEMRLWLTRRLMLGLWPLLSKLMTGHLLRLEAAGSSLETASDELKTMLADFRKQEFLQHADFETPYKEEQAKLPLGEEPLLVTDVDAAPLPNGRLRLSFNENTPPKAGQGQPRRFQMEMEPRLMQGLLHLLEQALGQSRWREPFDPGPASAEDPTHPDAASRLNRPRYLN